MQLQLHYITQHYTTLITLHYSTTATATATTTTLQYTTLHYTTLITLHKATPTTALLTLHYARLHYTIPHYSTLHYTNWTTPHLQRNNNPLITLQYNYKSTTLHYNYNCTTPHLHHTTSSSCGEVTTATIAVTPKNTGPTPFGPSVHSLCHPSVTTTNLSDRFPIFETSATALCGTTGTVYDMYTCMICIWPYTYIYKYYIYNIQPLRSNEMDGNGAMLRWADPTSVPSAGSPAEGMS